MTTREIFYSYRYLTVVTDVNVYFADTMNVVAAEEDENRAEISDKAYIAIDPFVDIVSFPAVHGILFFFTGLSEMNLSSSLL